MRAATATTAAAAAAAAAAAGPGNSSRSCTRRARRVVRRLHHHSLSICRHSVVSRRWCLLMMIKCTCDHRSNLAHADAAAIYKARPTRATMVQALLLAISAEIFVCNLSGNAVHGAVLYTR